MFYFKKIDYKLTNNFLSNKKSFSFSFNKINKEFKVDYIIIYELLFVKFNKNKVNKIGNYLCSKSNFRI